jgi:hypothetical protein
MQEINIDEVIVISPEKQASSLFGWLVADGWCWFVLREEYCWLVAGGWFVVREKYCWLVADKPSEQGEGSHHPASISMHASATSTLSTVCATRKPPTYIQGGSSPFHRG